MNLDLYALTLCIISNPGEEGEEELVLDTRGYPLIVSENLVQFAGLFGATDIHSNGRLLASGDDRDDILVWMVIY